LSIVKYVQCGHFSRGEAIFNVRNKDRDF